MKKLFLSFFTLLMCLTVIFALSACNDENENKDDHVHTPADPVRENEVASTCVSQGSYDEVIYCSECGEFMYSEQKYTVPHSDLTWIEGTPPTCEDEGVIGHYHCPVCEKNFAYVDTINGGLLYEGYFKEIDSVKIEATGHNDIIDGYNGACTVCGDPITESEGIVYSLSTDGSYAEVIDYTGAAKRIKIADTYEGVPVTAIATAAFRNKEISTVIIPDSATTIADSAFYGSSVTSIVIPDSVTTIGFQAFRHCYSLESVIIGNGVEEISAYAFNYCSALSNLIIGNSVKIISREAFSECNLSSVAIPNSVISIGEDAFAKRSLVFGESNCPIRYENGVGYVDKWVVSVGEQVGVRLRDDTVGIAAGLAGILGPQQPSKLRTIIIPCSVKYISNKAFAYCPHLTIYCEAESQPISWDSNWNSSQPVVWGYKETN